MDGVVVGVGSDMIYKILSKFFGNRQVSVPLSMVKDMFFLSVQVMIVSLSAFVTFFPLGLRTPLVKFTLLLTARYPMCGRSVCLVSILLASSDFRSTMDSSNFNYFNLWIS